MPPSKKLKASDLKSFDLAAAGHAGVLSDASGSLVIKPCTTREIAFYETAASHPAFAKWIPLFCGTLQLGDPTEAATAGHNRVDNIVLQNLTHGFVKPCVLDVKLGAQLWDEFAPPEKRARLDKVSDATTSRSLGMRVAGMRVWKGEGEGYKSYDKLYGRTFTKDNVVEAVAEFFKSTVRPPNVRIVAQRFLQSVKEIRKVLEAEEIRMYSASLLFVYEGDEEALNAALEEEKTRQPKTEEELEDDEEEEEVKKVEELKLIDFAHADWTPGQGPDENTLQGVRSMEMLLGEIISYTDV